MQFGTRGAAGPRNGRREKSRGAVLVEFALVAPLLFLLLFGIMEFGWAFFQLLDVRHGARETARLVAVNYKTNSTSTGDDQTSEIIAEGCVRMDSGDDVTIEIAGGGTVSSGATATIIVEKPLDTLTGFFDVFLGGIDLNSTVDIRVEQNSDWNPTTAPGAC